ncbi:hypothetical protein GQ53DRAFT_710066 [Thozetella sp. PMI_491]|nr:hypothetical protein GQ53DRAFT_710066 [Thozetella sp. PMI_491]
MADSLGRGSRRGRRVSSRTGSARSSAVFDDATFLHPGQHIPGSHPLRPAESRFSLHEQFALTRREYEFGFDDAASSILERSTVASEADRDGDNDDTVVVGAAFPTSPAGKPGPKIPINRDYYELLCLPKDPRLPPSVIRRAYARLFHILHSEKQPPYQRNAAAVYFQGVQAAFETLIEPYRKVDYDLSRGEEEEDVAAEIGGAGAHELVDDGSGGSQLYEQYINWTQVEPSATTDFALRVEADSAGLKSHRSRQRVAPLDFAIKQTATIELPALLPAAEKAVLSVQALNAAVSPAGPANATIRVGVPTATLTGSAHALLAGRSKVAPLLLAPYTPPGPLLHERRHLGQLLATRVLPGLNLQLRQELFWREPYPGGARRLAGHMPVPDTVIEQEFEILPEPAATTRVAHSFDLPNSNEPLHVEVSLQKLLRSHGAAPGFGLALHKREGDGTGFLVVDSGDWSLWSARECRHLSGFSKAATGLVQKLEVPRVAPTIEAGYTWSSYEMGLLAGRSLTKPAERNVRTLDRDMDADKVGSWSVSAAATTDEAACYLRYGRDLLSLVSPDQSSWLPGGNRSHRWSGIRGEVEFGATRHRDFWMAFRALKRIGRFSKLGFEVGLTRYSLYLSLYWSRLGQRFSLPFLVASKSSLTAEVAFWTTLVPFAAFALLEHYYWKPKSKARQHGDSRLLSKEDLHEYISKRRSEADDLTAILAAGAETRQTLERQKGGLVILSAKYGVKDAPPDEVADVTVAIGALVDNGELLVPGGLRKSHLLGFWDPAPLKTKVLYVRYLYHGKEHSIEVKGRDELILP